jgi:hypothetical protein
LVDSRPKVAIHNDANNLLGSVLYDREAVSSNEIFKQIKLDRKQSRQGFWLTVRAQFA